MRFGQEVRCLHCALLIIYTRILRDRFSAAEINWDGCWYTRGVRARPIALAFATHLLRFRHPQTSFGGKMTTPARHATCVGDLMYIRGERDVDRFLYCIVSIEARFQ
jgi:hypothetical protein